MWESQAEHQSSIPLQCHGMAGREDVSFLTNYLPLLESQNWSGIVGMEREQINIYFYIERAIFLIRTTLSLS